MNRRLSRTYFIRPASERSSGGKLWIVSVLVSLSELNQLMEP